MKIIIAYHAYLYGEHYVKMMASQFRSLIDSGLIQEASEMYIGLIVAAGNETGVAWVQNYWRDLPKVKIKVYSENREEAETMLWISEHAKTNPEDYILYFHTKGISKYSKGTEDWRKYMEYFVIENWRDCILKLNEGYDACGVLWNTTKDTMQPTTGIRKRKNYPHFSGTMWWATAAYINLLDDSYLMEDWRYYREFWIGSAEHTKTFEFHNSRLNDAEMLKRCNGHYKTPYPRSFYEKRGQVLHVICTAFGRVLTLQTLINSFILQTNPNWRLSIIHDGKPQQEMEKMISEYTDTRISFEYTQTVNGCYGHPNRGLMLQQIGGTEKDYVLITNDDNYYVPAFVGMMLGAAVENTGIIYCDTIHSYFGYTVHKSQLRRLHIDMGAFIVPYLIAKEIGFNDRHHSADGTYAEKCNQLCVIKNLKNVYIEKPLFIHN